MCVQLAHDGVVRVESVCHDVVILAKVLVFDLRHHIELATQEYDLSNDFHQECRYDEAENDRETATNFRLKGRLTLVEKVDRVAKNISAAQPLRTGHSSLTIYFITI